MATKSGYRAEPRSLRISSLVSNSVPKSSVHVNGGSVSAPGNSSDKNTLIVDPVLNVTYSKFVSVDFRANNVEVIRTLLLLGTHSGLHVWNISDTNDIRQIAFVKDVGGRVVYIEPLNSPVNLLSDSTNEDRFITYRPLISMIIEKNSKRNVVFYSLKLGKIVETLIFGDEMPVSIKSNGKIIAVMLSNGQLILYSSTNARKIVIFDDALFAELNNSLMDLGSRIFVYASSLPISHTSFSDFDESGRPTAPQAGEVAKVAGKVAKDLVGGVKAFGDMGYNAISNYFAKGATEI
ncbi:hypothetical protein HK096_004409, partial [Nowakowskiella sp. JEL0078]